MVFAQNMGRVMLLVALALVAVTFVFVNSESFRTSGFVYLGITVASVIIIGGYGWIKQAVR